MRDSRRTLILVLAGIAWTAAVACGLGRLWAYESTPSVAATAPSAWPSNTTISRSDTLPTLLLFLHPRCPCSRATVDELSKLMTECQGKLATKVLVLRPEGEPDGWERTEFWDSAAAIPGVTVSTDVGGVESHRFGGATSGQTYLFSPRGELLFAGGITQSRGHSGDNAGRAAIASIVLDTPDAAPVQTPVFGCPLFNDTSACPEGSSTCHLK